VLDEQEIYPIGGNLYQHQTAPALSDTREAAKSLARMFTESKPVRSVVNEGYHTDQKPELLEYLVVIGLRIQTSRRMRNDVAGSIFP
jgi:hypothetical protein